MLIYFKSLPLDFKKSAELHKISTYALEKEINHHIKHYKAFSMNEVLKLISLFRNNL